MVRLGLCSGVHWRFRSCDWRFHALAGLSVSNSPQDKMKSAKQHVHAQEHTRCAHTELQPALSVGIAAEPSPDHHNQQPGHSQLQGCEADEFPAGHNNLHCTRNMNDHLAKAE